jgi:predicted deacylase
MEPTAVKNWALSPENRPIELYHSATSGTWRDLKQPVVIIGGVHGDEPEGVQMAQSCLDWLLREGYRQAAVPWALIPCLNPDGYHRGQRVNARGVDLNRNYPAENWAPEFDQTKYYPGPHPASEPEIQALVELIQTVQPSLLIHCHSWQPCIICTGGPGQRAAECLAASSGYKVHSHIGYPTSGSLSQYGWHDNGIPVICIEEAENTPRDEVQTHFAEGFRNILCTPLEKLIS